jgi:hypothetical protein
MSWLGRAAARLGWVGRGAARLGWVGRATARLVPGERREWAEAVWAEAHQVPPGWPRLAWRAGGVWMIATQRRIGTLLLFAAAAGVAAWSAWPDASVGDAAVERADVIATVLLLAGLPLMARQFFDSPDNRMARWLRAGCYAALLAFMPAKAVLELFIGAVPRGGHDLHTFDVFEGHGVPGTVSGGLGVPGEVMILLLTSCYVAAGLALTARRAQVAPATLAVGAGAGLALGAVMYAVAPLGFNVKFPNRPWLHGSALVPFEVLAWVLLFCAPLTAGLVAGLRSSRSVPVERVSVTRARQGAAAGLVCSGVGALFVTVAGTGTTALLVKSAWVRGLLYHGQHLTASAIYGRELFACQDVPIYALTCVIFPIIGLVMGVCWVGYTNVPGPQPDGGRGGPGGPGGPPGPEPAPDPPDGGRDLDVPELVGAGVGHLT